MPHYRTPFLLGLTLLLTAPVTGALAAGVTKRVSVGPAGAQGDENSFGPAISGTGSLVAFYSYADNLVSGDRNDAPDILVRDRRTGTTRLVSLSSTGAQADDACYDPKISRDGRYIAFTSYADNLVPGDTNGTGDAF